MLETIREFAAERLEASGRSTELMSRHAAWFEALAHESLRHFGGPDQEHWLDRLDLELSNLRGAIAARDTDERRDAALALAAALRPLWLQRNHSAAGLAVLLDLTSRAVSRSGPGFAAATSAAAFIATWLGDYTLARPLAEASVAAYRDLGDGHGLAEALGTFAFDTIQVDPEAALSLFDDVEDLYQDVGDLAGEGQTYLGRATAQFALGRLADCRVSLVRSLEILRRAGDRYFELFTTIFLGRIEMLLGNVEAGIGHYRSVLETSRHLDLRLGIAVALDYFAEVAVWSGDPPKAVRLGSVARRLKAELGGGIPPRIGGALDPFEAGRAALAPGAFGENVDAGASMDLDSAIAEALAIEPPDEIPARAPTAGGSPQGRMA
jgi:hypothetical protein